MVGWILFVTLLVINFTSFAWSLFQDGKKLEAANEKTNAKIGADIQGAVILLEAGEKSPYLSVQERKVTYKDELVDYKRHITVQEEEVYFSALAHYANRQMTNQLLGQTTKLLEEENP